MRSRSARLSVYCRTIARSSDAHAQNGASCSSERRRRRAIGCPFKLEFIWYAFEPRIYRGFKRLRPRGFKWDRVQPSTAASPLPINHAIGRNVICVPLPSVAASRSSASTKEKASGAKTDRIERKKVMLAQAREIDAILVTELSRWGRSLQSLQAWD